MFHFSFVLLLSLLTGGNGQSSFDIGKTIATLVEGNIGSEKSLCEEHLKLYGEALYSRNFSDLWAFRMLDSTGRIPIGLLTLNTVSIGQFDECIKTVHPSSLFSGKHCMSVIGPSGEEDPIIAYFMKNVAAKESSALSMAFKIGLCIPSTCSASEINTLLSQSAKSNKMEVVLNERACWTKEDPKYEPAFWGFSGFLMFLAALVILSTAYDTYQQLYKLNKNPNKILISFSAYTNGKNLFAINTSSSDMSALHGMRTLSMMWVVFCHTFAMSFNSAILNLGDFDFYLNSPSHIILSYGFLSVDSFFFLSGLLVSFVFFRNISKNGYYDFPMSYIHRFLRLTPSYLVMMMANIAFLKTLNKGPLWSDTVLVDADVCAESWWGGVLYVQNYVFPESTCLGQSWYLSVDMQLFWLSPLLLIPIFYYPKAGSAFLGFIIVASASWTFAIDYSNGYAPNMLGEVNQFANDYVATHMRSAPWLVGLALGCAICFIKGRKITIKLPMWGVFLGFIISTAICSACLFGYASFQSPNDFTKFEGAFYLSFVRLGWPIGLAWITFTCIFGYGGVINWILSWNIFQPLGKLSYSLFLVHMAVENYRMGTLRTNTFVGDFEMIQLFFSDLVTSHIIALALYLAVEVPVSNLERMLLGRITFIKFPIQHSRNRGNEDSKGIINKSYETTIETVIISS